MNNPHVWHWQLTSSPTGAVAVAFNLCQTPLLVELELQQQGVCGQYCTDYRGSAAQVNARKQTQGPHLLCTTLCTGSCRVVEAFASLFSNSICKRQV